VLNVEGQETIVGVLQSVEENPCSNALLLFRREAAEHPLDVAVQAPAGIFSLQKQKAQIAPLRFPSEKITPRAATESELHCQPGFADTAHAANGGEIAFGCITVFQNEISRIKPHRQNFLDGPDRQRRSFENAVGFRQLPKFKRFDKRIHAQASKDLKFRKKTVCRFPLSLRPSGIRTNWLRVQVAGSAPIETAYRKNRRTFSSGCP